MTVLSSIQTIKGIADTAFDFLPGATFEFSIRAQGKAGGSGGDWQSKLGDILDAAGFAQTLVLKGGATPIDSMDFGGQTTAKKINYPGNDVASAQIITTTKTPLKIHGELKDNELNGATAAYYRDQIESLKRAKTPVSIEWGMIAKDAIIDEAQFEVHSFDHILYTITFNILADAGDGPFELNFKKPIRTALGTLSKLQSGFAGMTSVFNALPMGLGDKVLQKISIPVNQAAETATRVFKI